METQWDIARIAMEIPKLNGCFHGKIHTRLNFLCHFDCQRVVMKHSDFFSHKSDLYPRFIPKK